MDALAVFSVIGFMAVISFVGGLSLIAADVIIERCKTIGTILCFIAYIAFMGSLPVSLAAYFIFGYFKKQGAIKWKK